MPDCISYSFAVAVVRTPQYRGAATDEDLQLSPYVYWVFSSAGATSARVTRALRLHHVLVVCGRDGHWLQYLHLRCGRIHLHCLHFALRRLRSPSWNGSTWSSCSTCFPAATSYVRFVVFIVPKRPSFPFCALRSHFGCPTPPRGVGECKAAALHAAAAGSRKHAAPPCRLFMVAERLADCRRSVPRPLVTPTTLLDESRSVPL